MQLKNIQTVVLHIHVNICRQDETAYEHKYNSGFVVMGS